MKSSKQLITTKIIFSLLILCIISFTNISWEVMSTTKDENNLIKTKISYITKQNLPSPIILNSCNLTKNQLESLLIKDVRKIILQFANNANGELILVAYGADKDNEILSGPAYSTIVPNSAIPAPEGGVLGNMVVRRGQLKELFGHREGKHERIEVDSIKNIELTPNTKLKDGHVYYTIDILGKKRLLPIETNPSPPAKPCVDCENYNNNN